MRRGSRSTVAALVVLGAAITGCGESAYRYVSHSETNTYLKVPRDWERYDQDILAAAEAVLLEEQGDDPPSAVDRRIDELIQWRVAFDSADDPSPIHVAGLSENVVLDVRVRQLLDQERDQVNQAALRNLIVPYDELVQQEIETQDTRSLGEATRSDFRPLREEEITRDNGMRGMRVTFQLRGEDGIYTIDQVALVDGANSRLWILVVRASEQQYFANRDEIDEVIESFTIKQKG